MADVEVRDVLLRCGGRTLHRTGFLAAMGAGRGYVEVKETFTRADATTCRTFADRDVGAGQLLRLAEAGKVRIEYPPALSGLVDQFGYPYCGPSLEGSRTNSCLQSQAIDVTWTRTALTGITADATTAPDGTATADLIIPDAAASLHYFSQGITITANENLAAGVFLKAKEYSGFALVVSDNSVTNGFRVGIDLLTGTLNIVTRNFGTGTYIGATVKALGNGWYWIGVSGSIQSGVTTAVMFMEVFDTGARANTQSAYSGNTTSGLYAWGAQLERASAFPASYIKTVAGPVTGAADSLTLPFNFGPMDITVLARVARPIHADAVGALPAAPVIGLIGNGGLAPNLKVRFGSSSRIWVSDVDTSGTDAQQTQSVPAGATLAAVYQYRSLTTGGITKVDSGAGFTADSGAATGFSAFTTQVLQIGSTSTVGQELYGVLLDLIAARGQRTLAEMLAIP